MTVNLPSDLILQILSRLPSKSIARFRCLSKLWSSLQTLGSPYFTELFLTQSTTRPRLLFVIEIDDDEYYLYSSPQISCKNSESSLSVTAEFHIHMSLINCWTLRTFTLVSGLIYWPNMSNPNSPMLCNPTTRHLFHLPNITRAKHSFLGYNPINKQFSVLAISSPLPSNQPLPSSYQILNLESGKLFWRSLDCPLHHYPLELNICINGILYYFAKFGMEDPCKIVCFDFNSEEFKFIDQPWLDQPELLINFKGKLGGITTKWVEYGKEEFNLELSLSVLEDVEKEEWSKHEYLLPPILWNTKVSDYCVVGVTGTGDVVLSLRYINHPFYVYFFNLDKNSLRRVEIKGFEGFQRSYLLQGCVDYVEDLKALNWS